MEKLDNNTETSLQYSKENQAAENINITKNRPDILEDDNLSQDNFTASDKKNTGLNSESVQQDDKSDRQQTQALRKKQNQTAHLMVWRLQKILICFMRKQPTI